MAKSTHDASPMARVSGVGSVAGGHVVLGSSGKVLPTTIFDFVVFLLLSYDIIDLRTELKGDAMEQVEFVEQVMDGAIEDSKIYG